jgi:hypothetical protein
MLVIAAVKSSAVLYIISPTLADVSKLTVLSIQTLEALVEVVKLDKTNPSE